MTNREMLALLFENEDIESEYLTEYISCPDLENCEYEKPNAKHSACDICKANWLRSEVEQ